MGRIELVFDVADQIAQAILKSKIPMTEKTFDPNSEELFEPVSWPDTWIRYKKKVQDAEQAFGRQPLTPFQWKAVELYLANQYGLEL